MGEGLYNLSPIFYLESIKMPSLGIDTSQNKIIMLSERETKRVSAFKKLLFEHITKTQSSASGHLNTDSLQYIIPSLEVIFDSCFGILADVDYSNENYNFQILDTLKKEIIQKKSSNYCKNLKIMKPLFPKTVDKIKKTITTVLKVTSKYVTDKKQFKPPKKDDLDFFKDYIGFRPDEKIRSKSGAKKILNVGLGLGTMFAGQMFRSSALTVAGAKHLADHKKQTEKEREVYLKQINLIHKANSNTQTKRDVEKAKKAFSKFGGGGSYLAKKDSTVMLGDNPGGKEAFSISSKNKNFSGTTKGKSLFNVKAGSVLRAKPISGMGSTDINNGEFTKFGGGTGIDNDKGIISAINKQTKILYQILKDNNIFHKDQISRQDDAENLAKTFARNNSSNGGSSGNATTRKIGSVLSGGSGESGESGGFVSDMLEMAGGQLAASAVMRILSRGKIKKIPKLPKGGGQWAKWRSPSYGNVIKGGGFFSKAKGMAGGLLSGGGGKFSKGLGILGAGAYGLGALSDFRRGDSLSGGLNSVRAVASGASTLPGPAGMVGRAYMLGDTIGQISNSLIDKGVKTLTGGKNDSLGGFLYDMFHKQNVSQEGFLKTQDEINEEARKAQLGFFGRLKEGGSAFLYNVSGGRVGTPTTVDTSKTARSTSVNSEVAKKRERDLEAYARSRGITDKKELAAFMGTTSHESGGFSKMNEVGGGRQYEGNRQLGNTQAGDGDRYRGRGYIQLTGRSNYTDMSKRLGIDLVNNPDLAADPKIAEKIAVEYWKSRKISNEAKAGNIYNVRKKVNGGYNGMQDFSERYNKYLTQYNNPVATTPTEVVNAKQEITLAKNDKKLKEQEQQKEQQKRVSSASSPVILNNNNNTHSKGKSAPTSVHLTSGDSSLLTTYTTILGQT